MRLKKKIIVPIGIFIIVLIQAAIFPSIAPIISAIFMIAFPIVVAGFFVKASKTTWKIFGLGALAFIAAQTLHIPFNQFVLNPLFTKLNITLTPEIEQLPLIFISIILGLSAGIFEEVARYLWFRFFLKEKRDWENGFMLGLGHGGIEAIIIGAIGILTFFQISTIKNIDLATYGDQAQVIQETITTYLNTPWHTFLLGALERFSAIMIHIGLSVIVLQVFKKKKISWLFIAIGWHAFIDAFAVYGSMRWNIYILEIIILLLGIISILFAFKMHSEEEIEQKTGPLNTFSQEKVMTLSEIKQTLAEKETTKNTLKIEDSHYE